MQTSFSLTQLANPDVASSEQILRACVHCGFCIATCPTYALLGDELDSPRGRIYLIKEMFENDRAADAETVKHIDRCLSCLSCMTTCPSGVNYMHLVDHARHHIEKTYRRPLADRAYRRLLGFVLPRPNLFRLALHGAAWAKYFPSLFPAKMRAMLEMAPRAVPGRGAKILAAAAVAKTRRVALLEGCAQKVLSPQINAATRRLLARHGCEVVVAKGSGCCGALNHHLGQNDGYFFARANILAWSREIDGGGLDAIVVNTSGCGTTVKDYGFMFRDDPALRDKAAKVSALARDVAEFFAEIGLQAPVAPNGARVAYHSACSLQHGQRIGRAPRDLLKQAGFVVLDPPEGHLCCGSAGTYNLLQPDLAGRLRDRKARNLEGLNPQVIAAGNIGCITQIAAATDVPVVHTVELLDWATGGPRPLGLAAEQGGQGIAQQR
jgi:glycolate oxidase iron-sulfur subunit